MAGFGDVSGSGAGLTGAGFGSSRRTTGEGAGDDDRVGGRVAADGDYVVRRRADDHLDCPGGVVGGRVAGVLLLVGSLVGAHYFLKRPSPSIMSSEKCAARSA